MQTTWHFQTHFARNHTSEAAAFKTAKHENATYIVNSASHSLAKSRCMKHTASAHGMIYVLSTQMRTIQGSMANNSDVLGAAKAPFRPRLVLLLDLPNSSHQILTCANASSTLTSCNGFSKANQALARSSLSLSSCQTCGRAQHSFASGRAIWVCRCSVMNVSLSGGKSKMVVRCKGECSRFARQIGSDHKKGRCLCRGHTDTIPIYMSCALYAEDSNARHLCTCTSFNIHEAPT